MPRNRTKSPSLGKGRQNPNRLKAAMEVRLPDPTTIIGTELRKSTQTRTRIMQAAINCLAETGYAGTTTTTVSVRAGLTRATMLYHFPSRIALIEAVIHYVTRERIRLFQEAYTAMPEESRTDGRHIDIYWEQVQGRVYKAFGELSTASRTDPDLAAVLVPASAEFDRVRRETALSLFPPDFTQQPYFDLRRDITRYILEGLALLDAPSHNGDRRIADLISFLKALTTEPEGRAIMLKALKRSSSSRQTGK
jgi:AcrR family transcriptional regulator